MPMHFFGKMAAKNLVGEADATAQDDAADEQHWDVACASLQCGANHEAPSAANLPEQLTQHGQLRPCKWRQLTMGHSCHYRHPCSEQPGWCIP